ncbi:MAG: signal peptidase I [Clostridia bacterium]|nr:signal peptidase I [Clostridia bacterium]
MKKNVDFSRTDSKRKKGGNIIPALCNIFGIAILVGVILLLIPITVPKFAGYEVYNVVSPSMEPSIPMGSLVIVKPTDGPELEIGDVAAFRGGESVIAHRVTANRVIEGELSTKGDANEEEDINPVPYSNLVGRVERSIPRLGTLMSYLTTLLGKAYLLLVISCGVMFNMLASRLRKSRKT